LKLFLQGRAAFLIRGGTAHSTFGINPSDPIDLASPSFDRLNTIYGEMEDVEAILMRPRPPDDDALWRRATKVGHGFSHDLPSERDEARIGVAEALVVEDCRDHPETHVARWISVTFLQGHRPTERRFSRHEANRIPAL